MSFWTIRFWLFSLKKRIESSTVIFNRSSILVFWYFTCKISFLNLFPLQFSHSRITSAMNCISIVITPSPLQLSHLPPSTLNEKCFGRYFLFLEIFWEANNALISSYAFIYVIGFERDDLPIGFWSINSTLFNFFKSPFISENAPGLSLYISKCLSSAGYKIFFTKLVLPLPDTPLTTVNAFKGIFTSIFFRFCSLAPIISMWFFDTRLFLGISIFLFPFKYSDVRLSLFSSFFSVPCATISPPFEPALGPISIIRSAAFIISSSCSTTITVFPISLSFLRTSISFSLSLGCKPIDGSSSIYIEPTKLLPNEVANWILWDSPPDKVFDLRFKVR